MCVCVCVCVAEEKQLCVAKEEVLVPISTEAAASEGVREDATSHSRQGEEDPSKFDSKATLSSEEKMKLLSLYGCESDEEEYPYAHFLGGDRDICNRESNRKPFTRKAGCRQSPLDKSSR